MLDRVRACLPGILGLFLGVIPVPAAATPRIHPFTYTTATLPAGSTELEIYADVVPGSRVEPTSAMPDAPLQTYDGAYFMPQIELEHGVTDRFQLSFYNVFEQYNGGLLSYDGVRLEGIYRLSSESWPIQVGALFEFGYKGDEIELEERLLLERAIGRLRITANLWVEQELGRRSDRRDVDVLYRPTLAAAVELAPWAHLGAEYWGLYHFLPATPVGDGPFQMLHYAGPTLTLISGEWWVAVGVYARLYQPSTLVSGSDQDLQYNSVWTRLIVGGTL